QHHAIQSNTKLRLQIVSDTRPAKSAVALTDEIFPGTEPIVFHQPVVDHTRKILNIRGGAVEELLRIGLWDQCAAESSADRVDEDKISKVQPRARIVNQRRGIRRTVALIPCL